MFYKSYDTIVSSMSPARSTVLSFIINYSHLKGYSFATVKTMSECLGSSESSITRAINWLVKNDYIDKTTQKPRKNSNGFKSLPSRLKPTMKTKKLVAASIKATKQNQRTTKILKPEKPLFEKRITLIMGAKKYLNSTGFADEQALASIQTYLKAQYANKSNQIDIRNE